MQHPSRETTGTLIKRGIAKGLIGTALIVSVLAFAISANAMPIDTTDHSTVVESWSLNITCQDATSCLQPAVGGE